MTMDHRNREHFRRLARHWHRRSVFRRAWEKRVNAEAEAQYQAAVMPRQDDGPGCLDETSSAALMGVD